VYDYVATKVDWLVNGLPREGKVAQEPSPRCQQRRQIAVPFIWEPAPGPTEAAQRTGECCNLSVFSVSARAFLSVCAALQRPAGDF